MVWMAVMRVSQWERSWLNPGASVTKAISWILMLYTVTASTMSIPYWLSGAEHGQNVIVLCMWSYYVSLRAAWSID